MAAPRLRNKLNASTATRRASEEEEQDKVKGRKAKAKGKAEETEEEASEDDEDETTAEGEDEEPEASEDETEEEASEDDEEASDEEETQPSGKKGAKKGAAASERARIQAITGSAAAAKLPALANHLAFSSAMSAKAAGKLLAVALKDVEASAGGGGGPTPRAGAFRRAMESEGGNPKLGSGGAQGAGAPRMLSFHEVRAAKADAKRK